ncbi:MAG: DUF4288 domain-containing protein [Cytophagaceae bacterium]|nr:MAG: DUF4288 domain-containing protein [Cytophagaceae bacterium]
MEKLLGINEWKLPSGVPNEEIQIKIQVSFEPNYARLRELTDPKERLQEGEAERIRLVNRLVSKFNIVNYRLGHKFYTVSIDTTLNIAYTLAECSDVSHVTVLQINECLRRKRRRSGFCWYGIKVENVIQVEGRKKGLITVEEQILLVKGKSQEEAVSKVSRFSDDYATPYLNGEGLWVRWKFYRLIDVYETHWPVGMDLGDDVVEVFSVLTKKRFQDSYYWDGTW